MPRYNRTLTQFAVGKLEEFLELGAERFVGASAGNTAAFVREDGDITSLVFTLFDQEILSLSFDGRRFLGVTVSDGSFYDKAGNPSRTTRERQNGVLDAMGEQCLIPERVRVFVDKESNQCGVGRGAIYQRLGRGLAPVTIIANPVEVLFDV